MCLVLNGSSMMSKLQTIFVILLALNKCHSSRHRCGNDQLGESLLHEQELFRRNSDKRQNYTIAYKYLNSGISGIIHYVQLDVNGDQQSNASINFSKNIDVSQYRFVDASVRIENATDFISTIEIYGIPGFKFEVGKDLDWLFDFKIVKPRSYAVLCMDNSRKLSYQKKRVFEFGNRTTGDFLIYAQNGYGTRKKLKHHELTFNFYDPQIKITYLTLNSDSPWAIVFHNKIQMTENHFKATLYGLDMESFFVELFVFGVRK
ncbi:uncharacterized protein LOC116349485 [Contarinia nasturtii]|uniref:uncharacterized protein LOC116349485 n=1 Tax=Contarinia nasturtii TaxID=265458 RepID=UPI0012D4806E|nr:uncharacterized protein LOC116349485 [Contarinia nasturtii]